MGDLKGLQALLLSRVQGSIHKRRLPGLSGIRSSVNIKIKRLDPRLMAVFDYRHFPERVVDNVIYHSNLKEK